MTLPDRRLLLVHAHPDDETIGNGVTMARYAAAGARVTLITCTLGEYGEVLVPALVQLGFEHGDQLGGYRIGELAAACAALGVTDHRFLGGPGRWSDSGMIGTPPNDAPRSFWQADLDEATAALVAVIREVRPHVLLTYDENGGYGHPDHIQAHRVAMAGYERAADPAYRPDLGDAWQIDRVFWNAIPKSVLAEGIRRMAEAGVDFFGVDSVEDLPFGTSDELVTAVVRAPEQIERKMEAMRAHATQISLDGPFFALSNNVGQEVWADEYYQQVRGSAPGAVPMTDLFDGLDAS